MCPFCLGKGWIEFRSDHSYSGGKCKYCKGAGTLALAKLNGLETLNTYLKEEQLY